MEKAVIDNTKCGQVCTKKERYIMEWKEFSAKTTNEALTNALIEFNTSSDKVEYEVVEKESSKLLGLINKPAIIRVRLKMGYEEIAKDFLVKLMEMKKQYPKGELMAYYKGLTSWHFTIDSGYKRYYFDNDANITNIYIKGKIETNCIFWGMLPENPQIACYYYKKSDGKFGVFNSLMYENGLIKDKVQFFTGTGIDMDKDLLTKSMDAVLKKSTGNGYDYKGTNTSTTTDANNIWKSKVTNKTIEEKEVVNTYTFLDNGDIKVETRDNKIYTLNFWGATNYYNDLLGIYYIKIDLKDIFGIIAPNESTYFYYGYVLEYEGRFPKERGQDSFYITNSINWYEKNFDINGKPKGTIDWGNMLIQESRYTSPITTKDIILFEKQK